MNAIQTEGLSKRYGATPEAGANCLPAAFLFLGVGVLAFAAIPRASSLVAYGVVVVSFVWELIGALVRAPTWTLDLSPFHHGGLVPAHAFRQTSAIVMLAVAVAVAAMAVAVVVLERRDLTGA